MDGQAWMKPLRAQGLFSVEDIGVVFSNVEQLRMLNEELLTSLQGVEELPAAEQDVGRRFARFVDFLKMYFEYCANQAAAIERLQELKKAKPQLQQVLEVPNTSQYTRHTRHTHTHTHTPHTTHTRPHTVLIVAKPNRKSKTGPSAICSTWRAI
jgi:hypothetical protein